MNELSWVVQLLRPEVPCFQSIGLKFERQSHSRTIVSNIFNMERQSRIYFQFWNGSLIFERMSQIFSIWNDSLGFTFDSGTHVTNIFNFGTAVSDLLSILERQSQIYWIWNDSLGFNFNSGTPVSNIFNFGTAVLDLISIWNASLKYLENGTLERHSWI